MFWGIILKPGNEYPEIVVRPFKITMAVLADSQQINGDCSNIQGAKVKLEYNNQTYYLCRLNPLKLPQVRLNLEFSAGDHIKFCVIGPYEVHLSGYIKEPFSGRVSISDSLTPLKKGATNHNSTDVDIANKRITSESDTESSHMVDSPSLNNAFTEAEDSHASQSHTVPETSAQTLPKNRKRTSVSDSNLESKFGKIFLDMSDSKSEKLIVVDDSPLSSQPNLISNTIESATTLNKIELEAISSVTHFISENDKSKNLKVFVPSSTSPRTISGISSKENTPKGDSTDKEFIYPTPKLYPIPPSSSLLSSLTSSSSPSTNSLLPQAQTILSTFSQFQATPAEIPCGTFTNGSVHLTTGTFDNVSYPQAVIIATSPYTTLIGKAAYPTKSLQSSSERTLSIKDNSAKHPSPTTIENSNSTSIPENHPFITLALDHCSRISTQSSENRTIIEDISFGQGKRAQKGQRVFVRYVGVVAQSKKVIDSNLSAKMPFSFRLGMGEVIQGWDAGLEDMRVGGTRKLVIPSSQVYSNKYHPDIPVESDMLFIVKLVGLN